MRAALALLSIIALPALASPVSVVCVGRALDPQTGRQVIAGNMTFAFEFDESTQRMAVTEGVENRKELEAVSITPQIASGSDRKWIFEINRISGIASVRTDLAHDPQSARLGLGGDYFRGECAKREAAKF
jgi:hypothetical protein